MDFTTEQLNIMIQAVFNDDGAIEEIRKQIKQVVTAYDEEKKAAQNTKAEEKRAAEEKRRAAADQKSAAREQAAAKKQASEEEKAAARAAAEAERQAANEAKENAAAQAAAFAAMAAAAVKAFDIIRTAINTATATYNEYEAAVKGLNSISAGKGIDTSELEKSLASVTDAMFDATAAAASFKNLLSRGYSLDQATNTILRLKDAAAFGRQANYSLADAVKTATEGIKNENSILVDNAGVTKNVAKMWQDYAKARGITTESLTQAQKVEAEYLGIMEETALQVGDYEKSLDTLAGTQAKAANSAKLLATSYGEAMAPAVKTVNEAADGFLGIVGDIIKKCPGLAAGVTTGALAISGLGVAVTAAKAVMSLAQAAGALGISLGPVGLAIGALVTVTGLWTQAQANQSEIMSLMSEQAALNVQEHEAQTRNMEDEIENLAGMAKEYENLTSKTYLTAQEKSRLAIIEEALAQDHGIVTDAISGQADAYGKVTDQVRALIKARQEELANRKRSELYIARMAAEGGSSERREAERVKDDKWRTSSRRADASIEYNRLMREEYAPAVDAAAEYIRARMSDGLRGVQDDLAEQIADIYKEAANTSVDAMTQMANENFADQLLMMFDGIDLTEIQDRISAQKLVIAGENGIIDTDAEREQLANFAQEMGEEIDNALMPIKAWVAQSGASKETMLGFAASSEQLKQGLLNLGGAALEAGGAYRDMSDESREAMEAESAAQEELISGAQDLTDSAQRLSQNKDLAKRAREIADSMTSASDATGEWSDELKGYARMLGVADGDMDGLIAKLDELDASLAQDLQAISYEMNATEGELRALAESMRDPITGEVRVENTQAYNAIMNILQMWSNLQETLGLPSGDQFKKGGGGGGKSKAEREAEEAERAAQEAARAQEEAYRNALSRIDHKREMDEIGAQEEIDLLREVQRVHAQTEDQRMDISERIYKAEKALAQDRYDAEIDRIDRLYDRAEIDAQERIRLLEQVSAAYAANADLQKSIEEELYNARQELREQETDDIDRLGDGLTTALRARYEEQRDAEKAHLEESKQAWSDWSDETCEAIQAQIDALDKQQEAEDRQKTDANNLRAIDKAKQALAYETDEYNRRNLEKQIAQLEEKRAEQLKKWEISDQKEELRDEMQAIKDKAEQEQKAIDEEIDRVNALYEERLKAANIQAEAERLLMKGNQEQILDLIASYAPDYEATGKTLGERLFEGIQNAVGSFADWYAAFTERIEEIQYGAVQGALEAADRLHASGGYANAVNKPGERVINVEQNLTFNQPIERPSDVARRVEEMNLELADVL